jgi:molybdopterin-containing oxidoreductase family iron-sulfur binding subunit
MSVERNKVTTVDPRRASRRKFLKGLVAGAAASALPSKALGQGTGILTYDSWEEYFQKQFQEMTPDEVKATLARLEAKYARQYGKPITVRATPPMENVLFAYALDLNLCVGCRRCVYGCVNENNQSRRDPQIHYIRVLRHRDGEMELEKTDRYYDAENVPEDGYYYMPVQCQHCRRAPCVKACPVRATWTEPDGIVVVDYNWCIGCRYCMAACPYEGRYFNWGDPVLPSEEVNPDTHYLGNRPRMRGVVEKCTFCIQRVRERRAGEEAADEQEADEKEVRGGQYPACVEICPVGARKFGNLLDPDSEIRYVIANHRVFRLKEDLLTEPKFFYYFS